MEKNLPIVKTLPWWSTVDVSIALARSSGDIQLKNFKKLEHSHSLKNDNDWKIYPKGKKCLYMPEKSSRHVFLPSETH